MVIVLDLQDTFPIQWWQKLLPSFRLHTVGAHSSHCNWDSTEV